MSKLREVPPRERGERKPVNRRFNWPAVAMAARLAAGSDDPWILAGDEILRAHADQIRKGKKQAFRPPEHYVVQTEGSGDYAKLFVAYRGAKPLPGDSQEALQQLLADESTIQPDLAAS
jgi:hypothetical protein